MKATTGIHGLWRDSNATAVQLFVDGALLTMGWETPTGFKFNTYPERGIHGRTEWVQLLARPGAAVSDEFGSEIGTSEIMAMLSRTVSDSPEE